MLVAEYIVSTRAHGVAESYVIKQESHFRAHYLPRWSRLSDISTESIERYKIERIAELRTLAKVPTSATGMTTVYKELVTLSRFLHWCVHTRKALGELPKFERVKPVSDYLPPDLSRAQITALLRCLPDRRSHPQRCPVREFFTVQWAQGMRPGELMSLRWADVNFDTREITIRQSNDKARAPGGRPLPMDAAASEVLKGMATDARALPTARIFGKRDFRTSLTNAATLAKLPHVTPHHLRHARLTEMASSTRDTAAVQHFAGHKSLATTDRYVHSRVERARAVLDSITDTAAKKNVSQRKKREARK